MSFASFNRLMYLGVAIAVCLLLAPAAHAQVAPVPYLDAAGAFGFADIGDVQDWRSAPDEDGFRKGFTLRSFSAPVSSFSGTLGGVSQFSLSGLTSNGAQYGYSFKGVGDVPVTLFGGVTTLRPSTDVFTSLVNPGYERSNALSTAVNAGIEFKPASNISLSLSGTFVQPSAITTDTDLRSQLISGARR